MDTMTVGYFDVLSEKDLLEIEGGNWVQCGLGTVGGALTGAVAGSAVGTVTLPVVGTVSGAAVGFWGGGASGAAASCFP